MKSILDIEEKEDKPKVIDYACGSGHFLNEYANQIKPLVLDKGNLSDYHPNIFGIEKVSTFMHGQDKVNILYGDALSQTKEIQENSFSVLVANPPYSVKVFLEILSDKDKANYQLINNIDYKLHANNNNIQSFFIERTKQLLKPMVIHFILEQESCYFNILIL